MRLIALSALILAACATQQKQSYWEKPGSTRAQFDADMGYCRAQAFSVPGATQNLMQAVIVQNSCMNGKGWYLVER